MNDLDELESILRRSWLEGRMSQSDYNAARTVIYRLRKDIKKVQEFTTPREMEIHKR